MIRGYVPGYEPSRRHWSGGGRPVRRGVWPIVSLGIGTSGWRPVGTTGEEGFGSSGGRPVGITGEKGFGSSGGRSVGTTGEEGFGTSGGRDVEVWHHLRSRI